MHLFKGYDAMTAGQLLGIKILKKKIGRSISRKE
jgi:hypothetical protein